VVATKTKSKIVTESLEEEGRDDPFDKQMIKESAKTILHKLEKREMSDP